MNRIKYLRNQKSWKQEDLGKKLSVQSAAISKYETGRVPLTDEILLKLSRIFEVSIDYILGNTDIPTLPGKKELQNLHIIDMSELSEESRKDLVKQYELLKLRDNYRGKKGNNTVE